MEAGSPSLAAGFSAVRSTTLDVVNGFKWELYDLNKDWTQANDVAAQNANKLRDLKQLFTLEGSKYNVFPLDDSRIPRFFGPKPSYAPAPRLRNQYSHA
jgi:arylsulfatase